MSLASVLLPEPDGPTTPTICPAGTLKVMSCSTSGPSMRYRKLTCSKATSPRIAGSAVRPGLRVGSAAVLRISPEEDGHALRRILFRARHNDLIVAGRAKSANGLPADFLEAIAHRSRAALADRRVG